MRDWRRLLVLSLTGFVGGPLLGCFGTAHAGFVLPLVFDRSESPLGAAHAAPAGIASDSNAGGAASAAPDAGLPWPDGNEPGAPDVPRRLALPSVLADGLGRPGRGAGRPPRTTGSNMNLPWGVLRGPISPPRLQCQGLLRMGGEGEPPPAVPRRLFRPPRLA